MPKLLRAVRLDESDGQVFREHGAAREGEWVTTAGFAVCDASTANSFMAVESRARCTIAEVVEVSDADFDAVVDALAWQLVRGWNAPSYEAARTLAEEEARHTAEVCETLAPEVWITVQRERREEDGALEEQYSVYDRLLIGSHRA
jgi:uncharacterized protein DUF6505